MSAAELAEASLAGLPAEERAAQLSGAAGGGGASVPSRPSYDDYESVPVLNRMTGRVTAGGPGVLFGEDKMAEGKGLSRDYYAPILEHHMDVRALEAWLEERAATGGKGPQLPQGAWKVLKARRVAKKKEMSQKWLRDELE